MFIEASDGVKSVFPFLFHLRVLGVRRSVDDTQIGVPRYSAWF
jgi:hypothetical protein